MQEWPAEKRDRIFVCTCAVLALVTICYTNSSRSPSHGLQLLDLQASGPRCAQLMATEASNASHVHPVFVGQQPADVAVIPTRPLTDDINDFLRDLKEALDENQISQRPIAHIFSSNTSAHFPLCEGQWLEFGVAAGATTTWAAKYREAVCGTHAPPVVGFDTFTGLPEDWGSQFSAGHFSQGGNLPSVPHNARLVKGLFNETLPEFLEELDQSAQGISSFYTNVTFLHVDCDLYAGARDALAFLSDRIHPGCVLIFDDLLHYPGYREHEVKALWEWLHASHRRLQVIGIFGPLPERTDAVELEPVSDYGYYRQSVSFVVL